MEPHQPIREVQCIPDTPSACRRLLRSLCHPLLRSLPVHPLLCSPHTRLMFTGSQKMAESKDDGQP